MYFVLTTALLFFHILAWCAVLHALLTKQDPRSALGWIAVLLLVPLLGLCLYVLFGISRTQSRAAAIMSEHARLMPKYAHPDPRPEGELLDIPVHLLQMEQIGHSLTHHSLCQGNDVRPLFNGNEAYPCMIEAIKKAKKHVFLVTYIFNDGEISRQFVDALSAAADRGVDVRVILDGVGRLYSFKSPMHELAARKVRTAWFLPPKLFPPNLMINLRNHRKILVCDDIAFTGGMNIADYHVVTPEKPNAAQDIQFKCTGPIVLEFYRAFLMDWGFATREYDTCLPDMVTSQQGSCYCRLVLDGPGTGSDPLNDVLAGTICNAMRSVTILTPYFLPTREITAALRVAAQKGVDVRVVLPEKNNLRYMHWASQRVLPSLLQAGVRIYYQPAPFAHTKLLCIDDYYCQIGSANLDSRSLRLNFELNTEVFNQEFNRTMTAFTREVIARSREVFLHDIRSLPLAAKIRSSLFWLYSPYL